MSPASSAPSPLAPGWPWPKRPKRVTRTTSSPIARRESRRVADRNGRVGLAVQDEHRRLDAVGNGNRRKCPELAAQLRTEGGNGVLRRPSVGRGQQAARRRRVRAALAGDAGEQLGDVGPNARVGRPLPDGSVHDGRVGRDVDEQLLGIGIAAERADEGEVARDALDRPRQSRRCSRRPRSRPARRAAGSTSGRERRARTASTRWPGSAGVRTRLRRAVESGTPTTTPIRLIAEAMPVTSGLSIGCGWTPSASTTAGRRAPSVAPAGR